MTSRRMERGGMLAALLLISGLLPTLAQAQIYRWVDDSGAVHYSQSLDSVPERYRSQARSLDPGSSRPAPAPAERPPSPPPSPGPAVPLPSSPRARWGPNGALPEITRVPLLRSSHLLVEAWINGQGPVKLLLDTGSHQTHVSARAVRTLRISAPTYPCRSCEIEMTGGTRVVREVQVLSLRVGDAEMTGPAFMDETDSHEGLGAAGVLGRSFLDTFRVTLDFAQDVAALVPATVPGSVKYDPGVAAAYVTRITFPPHPYILIRGTINDRGPVTLVLDTGAPNTWLSARALRSLGIPTENAENQVLPGRNVRAVRVNVASVAVGAAKVGPLRIGAFVELETVAGADGLLGLDFLKNFTVTIDPAERVVILERSTIAQRRTTTARPTEPVVTPGSPGDPQVPRATPLPLERWSLLGLAALVALAVGALRIVRRRREGSPWAPARQGRLTCPQCSARLARLVDGQGIEVNWCGRCGGTWHDKGILDEFTRESQLPRLLQEPAASWRYPSDRRCPRCDVPMETSAAGAGNFVVERCRSCQGLWFGRREAAPAAAEKGKGDETLERRRPPAGRGVGTTDGLTVRFSRTKPVLVVLGLLSLVVLVAGVGLLDSGDRWDMMWPVSFMALIGFGLLYVLYRVCRRRPALIVNHEGIVDHTTPFSAGTMRWADIAELMVQGSPRNTQLILWIVPDRSNPRSRLTDIRIPRPALRMSPEMFVQEIRRYCPKSVQIHWKP